VADPETGGGPVRVVPVSADSGGPEQGGTTPGAPAVDATSDSTTRNRSEQRVAVVIPAKDEQARIAATVRAAKAIPNADLVVVVDDGSIDDTQHVARAAGAVVVRHSVNRGKASAMETGASVVAMRDVPGSPPRLRRGSRWRRSSGTMRTATTTATATGPAGSGVPRSPKRI
jgi:hypothetical protein